jgi:hypothetical protein
MFQKLETLERLLYQQRHNMAYVKIKDNDKLIRDTHSKAILNTDRIALEQYYTKRAVAKKQQQEQYETKQKIAQLEKDMSEIKDLLKQIALARKS